MNFLKILQPNGGLLSNSGNILNNFTSIVGNALSARFASKQSGSNTRNKKGKARPKHRGIHRSDGAYVQKGTLLVTQNKLRCHPGLNVGIGKNRTLFAMEPGTVIVTCERINPNLEHSFVKQAYGGRVLDNIFKKYFHVLPEEPHYRFKKISD